MRPDQQKEINELNTAYASGKKWNDLKWAIHKPYTKRSWGGSRPDEEFPLTDAEADELIAKLRASIPGSDDD